MPVFLIGQAVEKNPPAGVFSTESGYDRIWATEEEAEQKEEVTDMEKKKIRKKTVEVSEELRSMPALTKKEIEVLMKEGVISNPYGNLTKRKAKAVTV